MFLFVTLTGVEFDKTTMYTYKNKGTIFFYSFGTKCSYTNLKLRNLLIEFKEWLSNNFFKVYINVLGLSKVLISLGGLL